MPLREGAGVINVSGLARQAAWLPHAVQPNVLHCGVMQPLVMHPACGLCCLCVAVVGVVQQDTARCLELSTQLVQQTVSMLWCWQ